MIFGDDLGLWELAATLAIFFVGGFVKGAIGFGLPMITMSLIVLFAPAHFALALNSVVQPATNLTQFLGSGKFREVIARFWPVLAALPIGVGAGAYFLTELSEGALLVTMGCFVIAFVTMTSLGVKIPISRRWEKQISFVIGVAAGVLGALTAAPGPIFVVYMVSLGLDRATFRATVGLLFLFGGFLVAGSLLAVGVLDLGRFLIALVCLAPAMLGMWAGDLLGRRMGGLAFRNAVLAALFILGLNFLGRGTGLW